MLNSRAIGCYRAIVLSPPAIISSNNLQGFDRLRTMKRPHDANTDEAGPSSSRTKAKKSKSLPACASCRRSKTRCELLDPSQDPVRCHRCEVLDTKCSYEGTIVPTAPKPKESLTRPPSPANVPPLPGVAGKSAISGTDTLWSFVADKNSKIDWSAPILAMQELSKWPMSGDELESPVYPLPGLSLNGILSDTQIIWLLDL